MNTPNTLKYSEEHEWVRMEGDIAFIGITDYAQHALGDVVFVELPDEGAELKAGDTMGTVESVKAVSDIYSPVSGKVIVANKELFDNPALVNEDAYESWMVQVKISDSSELDELLDAKEYEKLCAEEE